MSAPSEILPATAWASLLADHSNQAVTASLESIYGTDKKLVEAKRTRLIEAVKAFLTAFPSHANDEVLIVRSPARVNLRGMHIDSHGGPCNSIAITRETVLVAHPCSRDTSPHLITLENTDKEFAPLHIDITALSSTDTSGARSWGRYIMGTLATLKEHFRERPLFGFTGVITSDIPKGAGISSSHSLVLCIALAVLQVNKLELNDILLIELARAAERKAGAVTGLGDQGTIRFARQGKLLHCYFYQEDLKGISPQYVDWPSDLSVVVVDTLKRRSLAGAEAKNYAVPRFAYSVALGLFKEVMLWHGFAEEFVATVDRLSRISAEHFAVYGGCEAIYRLLKGVPEYATVAELVATYPSLTTVILEAEEKYLARLSPEQRPDKVELRGALLFGIAECARARKFFLILCAAQEARARGQLEHATALLRQAGELMNIGHEGDSRRNSLAVDDRYLDGLIEQLHSKDPANVAAAQLERQPGDFRASSPELDEVQELLIKSGAYGASLTGAGMGGVVVGVLPKQEVATARKILTEEYFGKPHSHFPAVLPPSSDYLFETVPVQGAGLLKIV